MFSTLRARMIAICLAISLISLIILAAITFWNVRESTLETFEKNITSELNGRADEISAWFDGRRRFAYVAAMAVGEEDPMPMLRQIRDAGDFLNVFFTRVDKKTYSVSDIPSDYDGTQRPWFKIGAQAQDAILTPARVDAFTKKLIVGAVKPVQDEAGNLLAVAVADIELSSISEVVGAMKPFSDSFAFLVAEENKVIAYEHADKLFKPATEIHPIFTPENIERIASTGYHPEIENNGRLFAAYATKVKNTAYTLVLAIPEKEITKDVRKIGWTSVTITIVSTLIAAFLLVFFIRAQLGRLTQAQAALNDIASGEGDLTHRLDASGTDELAQIGKSFNIFVDKIAGVLRQIRDSAQSVQMAATEIASGNQDLSTRTEAQAGSLEQTSSAMEQITATVQQNADNATQANQVGKEAAEVATRANAAVQQVVTTMGAISESANKIKDIIGVIDSIAFQTNILALNAAVEAARAGEQGRGFAVVAAEVRSLAQRSATAAKEIKDLIDESVRQAEAGSRLVDDAGMVMGQVVDRIAQASTIVGEITNASREQSAGITEVGNAITQMDQSTQQNAALVEQAAAAAQSLQQQAAHLSELVAAFKLDREGALSQSLRLR